MKTIPPHQPKGGRPWKIDIQRDVSISSSTNTLTGGVCRARRHVQSQKKSRVWARLAPMSETLQGAYPCLLEISTHFLILGKHLFSCRSESTDLLPVVNVSAYWAKLTMERIFLHFPVTNWKDMEMSMSSKRNTETAELELRRLYASWPSDLGVRLLYL